MNEKELCDLRLKQAIELNKTRIGIDWHTIQKYRLDKFELTAGNKAAFYLACDYIHITSEAKNPVDIIKDSLELDDWYAEHCYTHHFLTLAGECGRGKTHLALGIEIAAVELMGLSAVYYQVPDLLAQLRQSFNDNSDGDNHRKIMNRCKNSDVLVLDDLGMQKDSPWVLEQLDSIIDSRYIDNELYTIITTNLGPAQLPPRIASRLSEGEIVTLTGPDYRKLIAKQRTEKRHFEREVKSIISEEK